MGPRAKRGAKAEAAEEKPQDKKAKSGLAVGDDLPPFELETDEDNTVASADLVKDNGIVLFAYPKANTKGCTSQAVGLSDKVEELAAAGYKVYGISADKPKSQANWRSKEGLAFNLLCDPSYEVLAKLGFASGKKINRSHIVVAKGGKVLDVQYGITPKNSVKDAITFCLAHKAEPVAGAAQPADKEAEEEAEEAAEAGEQKEKEEEQEGQEAAGGKEAAGDKAAAMDVDEPAAQEDQDQDQAADEPAAEPAKEEDKEAAKEEDKEAEKEDKAAEEPAPDAAEEKPAEEPAAAEEKAAEEAEETPAATAAAAEAEDDKQPEAAAAPAAEHKPAAEEPAAAAAEDKPAEDPAAEADEKPADEKAAADAAEAPAAEAAA